MITNSHATTKMALGGRTPAYARAIDHAVRRESHPPVLSAIFWSGISLMYASYHRKWRFNPSINFLSENRRAGVYWLSQSWRVSPPIDRRDILVPSNGMKYTYLSQRRTSGRKFYAWRTCQRWEKVVYSVLENFMFLLFQEEPYSVLEKTTTSTMGNGLSISVVARFIGFWQPSDESDNYKFSSTE